MTIRELGAALRRFWPLALGVFALIVLLGALAAFIPADRYRSTETLLLEPRASDAAVQIGAQLDVLAPPVIEQVGSDEFLAKVEAEAPETVGKVTLSAESEPGTGIVFIHAESSDPDVVQAAAEAAATEVRGHPPTDLINISVLTPATEPASISGSRRAVLLFGSIAFGLIAAVFAVAGAQWLRPRPSSAAFIRDRYGIQVIGEVPQRRRLRTAVQLSNGTASQEIFESFQKLAVNLEILTRANSVLATTSWAQEKERRWSPRSSAGRSRRCSTRSRSSTATCGGRRSTSSSAQGFTRGSPRWPRENRSRLPAIKRRLQTST